MAIQGTFLADFEQFNRATKDATTTLQTFERASKSTEKSLDTMTTAAPAGLKKVTDTTKESDAALLQMGQTVNRVAGYFGLAFGATTIINFGREIFRAADELQKLSDKTGLSVEALQAFKVAGDEAGVTIDTIARASTQLQDRLASGDRSAVQAVKDLGLSLEDLRSMRADEQLIAISDALRGVGDSGDQIRIINDLMGRMGAELLPLMKRGFDDVRDGAVGMSEEAVTALDAVGDAFTRAITGAKNFVGEGLGRIFQARQQLEDAIRKPFEDTADQLQTVTALAEAAAPKMAGVAPPGLPEDLDRINQELKESAEELIKVNEFAEKTAVAYQKLMSSVANEEGLAQMKEAEETMKRQAANQEGLWLRARDAFQQQQVEQQKAMEAEKAFQDQLQKDNEEGLVIIGEASKAVTVFGETTVAATGAATQGYHGFTSAVRQAGDAIDDATLKTVNWAQAYQDAGFIVGSSPFLGTQLTSMQNRALTTPGAGGPVTINATFNGVIDTASQDALRSAVSDAFSRAVTQGRRIAA